MMSSGMFAVPLSFWELVGGFSLGLRAEVVYKWSFLVQVARYIPFEIHGLEQRFIFTKRTGR